MRSLRTAVVLAFSGAQILGLLGSVPPAQGASISPTVFTDDDTNNGNCTLREAIISANTDAADDACAAGSGVDEINLAAGTYELSVGPAGDDAAATGDLDITDPDGLTITGDPGGSTVDGNAIDRVFHVRGGGKATFDLLTITGGDVDGFGGGISIVQASTANVDDTTLTGNTATSEGGAIDLIGAGSTLNLSDSTLAGNSTTDAAQGDGGAIAFQLDTTVNVTNSTLSGNTVPDQGGAVEAEPGGVGTFLNSTITNNTAPDEGGISQQGDAVANLKGTILAGNTATGMAPECNAFTSQGHNLIGDSSGCTITSQQATDITGVDPLLRPLADNGGPTGTHALLKASPAIDAGGTDCASTDQRGAPRSACDIGAYELVVCAKVAINRVGTVGPDTLTGTAGGDGFLGLGGNDRMIGLGGNDAVCGGGGNDRASGGSGKDRLRGEGGKDSLRGGGGRDRLAGGPGKDSCGGGPGRDRATCEKERKVP